MQEYIKNFGIWKYYFNNFKWRNEWYNENYSSSCRFWYFFKGVTKTIKNETTEQNEGFLSMLLGTLGARLIGNL